MPNVSSANDDKKQDKNCETKLNSQVIEGATGATEMDVTGVTKSKNRILQVTQR